MNETLLPIKLRRDQVSGLFAHLPPSQADAVADDFKECRAPMVRASKSADWADVPIKFGFKPRRERPRKPTEFAQMGRKYRAALGLPERDELAGPGQPTEPLALGWRPATPLPTIVKPVPMRGAAKVGRHDPCPCGSRKKFKKCCGP